MNKTLYLGKSHYINNGIDMSDEFLEISIQDEKSAMILYQQGFYNQSVYFYIQSMEKYIKNSICKKVDITNPYYANKLRELGHSFDDAIDFYIEIISGKDEVLRMQIIEQLKNGVLRNPVKSMVCIWSISRNLDKSMILVYLDVEKQRIFVKFGQVTLDFLRTNYSFSLLHYFHF